VLAPGTGKTKTGRLWVYLRDERDWSGHAPPAAFYRFTPDRKGRWPRNHLKEFKGWLHVDGYAGFEELYHGGKIKEVACLVHIRRKFYDMPSSKCACRPRRKEGFRPRCRTYSRQSETVVQRPSPLSIELANMMRESGIRVDDNYYQQELKRVTEWLSLNRMNTAR